MSLVEDSASSVIMVDDRQHAGSEAVLSRGRLRALGLANDLLDEEQLVRRVRGSRATGWRRVTRAPRGQGPAPSGRWVEAGSSRKADASDSGELDGRDLGGVFTAHDGRSHLSSMRLVGDVVSTSIIVRGLSDKNIDM